MRSFKTLEKLSKNELSLPKAYAKISGFKHPARFIRIKIKQDDKTAQRILNTIFFFPLPVRPAFFFLKRMLPREERDFFKDMLVYAKGIRIDIESKDADIHISVH
jgi:hypothetical protein